MQISKYRLTRAFIWFNKFHFRYYTTRVNDLKNGGPDGKLEGIYFYGRIREYPNTEIGQQKLTPKTPKTDPQD